MAVLRSRIGRLRLATRKCIMASPHTRISTISPALLRTTPASMAGTIALLDYLAASEVFEVDYLKEASTSISNALRNLAA